MTTTNHTTPGIESDRWVFIIPEDDEQEVCADCLPGGETYDDLCPRCARECAEQLGWPQ